MAQTLSTYLVQEGIVPVNTVEEAIARQVLYGGSLGTNLLEMGAITEQQLLTALSRVTGLPPADYAWIDRPNHEAQKILGKKMAERYRMIPVEITDTYLACLMEKALDPTTYEELAFLIGREIRGWVLPELRFAQALERHLAVPMRPRFRNLLEKLDEGLSIQDKLVRTLSEERRLEELEKAWGPKLERQRAITPPPTRPSGGSLTLELLDTVPQSPGPREEALAAGVEDPAALLSDPQLPVVSVAEPEATGRESEAMELPSAPGPEPPEEFPPEESLPPVEAPSSESLGDYDLPAARPPSAETRIAGEEDLDLLIPIEAPAEPIPSPEPSPREAPFRTEAVSEASEQQEAVPDPTPETKPGPAEEAPPDPTDEAVESRPTPSHLAAAAPGREVTVAAPAPQGGAEGPRVELQVEALERASEVIATASDRDTMIRAALDYLLLFADHAYSLVVRKQEVVGHLEAAPGGVERLDGVSVALPAMSSWVELLAGMDYRHGRFDEDQQTVLLYSQLGRNAPADVLHLPVKLGSRPVLLFVLDREHGRLDPAVIPTLLVLAQRLARGMERLIMARRRSAPREAQRPEERHAAVPKESITERMDYGGPGGEAGQTEHQDDGWDIVVTQVREPHRSSAQLGAVERVAADAIDVRIRRDGQDAGSEPVPPETTRIVDRSPAELVRLLDDEVLGPDARQEILARGPVKDLMDEFPGPITKDRDTLVPEAYPPIEKHGPLLSILVEFGESVLPWVLEELDSSIISRRFYAALLAARIGGPEVAPRLGVLLFDPVAMVREAAREALAPFAGHEACESVAARIVTDLEDPDHHCEHLRQCARAAARFRLVDAIEPLIRLLDHRDPKVTEEAYRALRVITRQDRSRSPRSWRRWYRKASGKDRIEWLIDALVQDNPGLRQEAAKELHRLTGQRIPVDVHGPIKEWKRAQAKWRTWWNQQRLG